MNTYKHLAMFIILAFLVGSCNQSLAAPTPTPFPTSTPTLTSTSTSTPTFVPTSTPTLIPTATSVIPLGEKQIVEWGGFAFRPPVGYSVETKAYNSTIISPDMSIIILLSGEPNINELSLDDLASEMSGSEEESPVTLGGMTEINGEKGMTIAMDMGFFKMDMVLALSRNGKQEFVASSMIMGGSGLSGGSDSEIGPSPEDIIQEILRTVEFFDIPEEAYLPELDPTTCKVTTDKNYGFSEDNPVVVYSYPLTDYTDKYLQVIAGPNGEEVSVVVNEETSVTVGPVTGLPEPVSHVLTYAGQNKQYTLYILKLTPEPGYIYQSPLIPAGFTCKSDL